MRPIPQVDGFASNPGVIFESRNDIWPDVIKDVIDLIRFLPTNQQEGGAGLQQP